jgi:hypothetical protein
MKDGLNTNSHGDKFFYKNYLLHREDGPAVEFAGSGTKMWHINGVIHREDGPAVESKDGNQWYLNGDYINVKSQKEFEQYKVLIAFQ